MSESFGTPLGASFDAFCDALTAATTEEAAFEALIQLAQVVDSTEERSELISVCSTMRISGAMERICLLAAHSTPVIHQVSLMLLATVTSSDDDREHAAATAEIIKASGAISTILFHLCSSTALNVAYACACVQNLSSVPVVVEMLHEGGGVDRLRELVTCDAPAIVACASAALHNLEAFREVEAAPALKGVTEAAVVAAPVAGGSVGAGGAAAAGVTSNDQQALEARERLRRSRERRRAAERAAEARAEAARAAEETHRLDAEAMAAEKVKRAATMAAAARKMQAHARGRATRRQAAVPQQAADGMRAQLQAAAESQAMTRAITAENQAMTRAITRADESQAMTRAITRADELERASDATVDAALMAAASTSLASAVMAAAREVKVARADSQKSTALRKAAKGAEAVAALNLAAGAEGAVTRRSPSKTELMAIKRETTMEARNAEILRRAEKKTEQARAGAAKAAENRVAKRVADRASAIAKALVAEARAAAEEKVTKAATEESRQIRQKSAEIQRAAQVNSAREEAVLPLSTLGAVPVTTRRNPSAPRLRVLLVPYAFSADSLDQAREARRARHWAHEAPSAPPNSRLNTHGSCKGEVGASAESSSPVGKSSTRKASFSIRSSEEGSVPERSRKFSLPGGKPAFALGVDEQPVIEDDEAELRAEIEADQQVELSGGARMPVEHGLLVNQVVQMAAKASEADPVYEPNYDPIVGCMNEQNPSPKRTVEAKTLHARLQHARLQQGMKHLRSAPVLTYFPVGEVEGEAEGEYQAWREARRTAEGKMNELLRRERHSHSLALSQKRAIAQHNLDRSRIRFAGRQQSLHHSLAELRRAKARPSGPTLTTAAHKPAILGAPGGDWSTSVRLTPSYTTSTKAHSEGAHEGAHKGAHEGAHEGALGGSSQSLSLIADPVDASLQAASQTSMQASTRSTAMAQTSMQASTRPTRPLSAGRKATSATDHSPPTSSLFATRPQSAGILPSQRSPPLLRPQSAFSLGLVTVLSAQHAAQPRYSAGVRAMITAVQPSPAMRAAPSALPASRMQRTNTHAPTAAQTRPHRTTMARLSWGRLHGDVR